MAVTPHRGLDPIMPIDSDVFPATSIDLSILVVGVGLFILTALTSGRHGRARWKYLPIIVSAFILALLRYVQIIPAWPHTSAASLASFLVLIALTCCLIVDLFSVSKWIRRENRPSNRVVLIFMTLMSGLLVSAWVIHVEEMAFMLRMERQEARLVGRSTQDLHQ